MRSGGGEGGGAAWAIADRLWYREVHAGVVVVNGPGGRGMPVSAAIGEDTFAAVVDGRQAGAVEDPAAGTKRRFGVMPPLSDFGEYREIAWQPLPDPP